MIYIINMCMIIVISVLVNRIVFLLRINRKQYLEDILIIDNEYLIRQKNLLETYNEFLTDEHKQIMFNKICNIRCDIRKNKIKLSRYKHG
jgi:hypothetical protein